MVALFKEVVSDVRDRRDLHTILALSTLAIALISILFRATTTDIFNFVFLINLAFTGWMLHVGWLAKKQGKITLLVIAALALLPQIVQMWQIANAMALVSQIEDFGSMMEGF